MESGTWLHYCTNCSGRCFLPSCILKGKVGQLSTIFVSWRCNSCKETALICSQFRQHSVSVSICLFVCFFVSASTVVPTDLLSNSFMFGCLSRQLGKEVVSNWRNICYLVLSHSIPVNKCLKSITKCGVSSLHLLGQAISCSCLPSWLLRKTFCLLFCPQ